MIFSDLKTDYSARLNHLQWRTVAIFQPLERRYLSIAIFALGEACVITKV